MSSTNKTTNYQLSQYIGTDKPTYLGDYNGDMLKIDTQMKKNADSASSATASAGSALSKAENVETSVSTLSNKVNATEISISNIQSDITDLKTGVAEAKAQANIANGTAEQGVANANTALVNINNALQWKSATSPIVLAGTQAGSINFKWNVALKLLSIYGNVSFSPQGTYPTTGILCALPSDLVNDLGINATRNIRSACIFTAGSGQGSAIGNSGLQIRPANNDLYISSSAYIPDQGSGHTTVLNVSFFGYMG